MRLCRLSPADRLERGRPANVGERPLRDRGAGARRQQQELGIAGLGLCREKNSCVDSYCRGLGVPQCWQRVWWESVALFGLGR